MPLDLLRVSRVSVIIPAYNEASRISRTLDVASDYLERTCGEYEMLVVDDGSLDDTFRVVEERISRQPSIRLLKLGQNIGKGAAIRQGVLAARGDLVLISDADLSTPIEEMEKLVAAIDLGAEAAIGSRALSGSEIIVHQPWYRELMGRIFNLFVRAILVGGFSDTQCGFKLFKREVAQRVFARSLIRGFGFDGEVLFLMSKLGYRVIEVPVKWVDSPATRVRLMRDPARMFFDLFRVRANWLRGRYESEPAH